MEIEQERKFLVDHIPYNNPFPEKLPKWIGKEVTGIYEYSNVAIALRNADSKEPRKPHQ
jgi:CYTH domain-containing protein